MDNIDWNTTAMNQEELLKAKRYLEARQKELEEFKGREESAMEKLKKGCFF